MSSQTVAKLKEFVLKAQKLGKYSPGASNTTFSCLKIVEAGITADEPDTVDYVKDHLEEIFHRQIDRLSLSAASMQTYIRGVRRIMNDFQSYGQDSKAMMNWKPKIISRGPRVSKIIEADEHAVVPADTLAECPTAASNGFKTRTVHWSLRPDLTIQIQIPIDFNPKDAERLKKLIDLETELMTDGI